MPTPKPDYRIPMLLLLSFVTGIVDAVSVLGLNHTFVANMTGNVVFLGFAAAGERDYHALPLVVSILAFVTGAASGGRIAKFHTGRTERRWFLTVSLLEAALLLAAMAMTLLSARGPIVLVVAAMAFAMGLRNATVRRLGVPDLSTTVLTLTLTGVGADSRLGGGTSTNWQRRLLAAGLIFAGAAFGAVLLRHFGAAAPLLCAAVLTVTAAAMSLLHPDGSRPSGT